MTGHTRRQFLAAGAGVGVLGLAGCLGSPLQGPVEPPDLTVYVGAYHWGFVLLDGSGAEHERLTVDSGTRIALVLFNTAAVDAIERLPEAVRSGLPDHEALEARNAARIPDPSSGGLHEALDVANAQYPDHSVAVMPSGYNEMPMGGGPMHGGGYGPMGGSGQTGGGMMLPPVSLPHDASVPATAGIVASQRGDYTLSCQAYCGYGHPFMELDGAFVVR